MFDGYIHQNHSNSKKITIYNPDVSNDPAYTTIFIAEISFFFWINPPLR